MIPNAYEKGDDEIVILRMEEGGGQGRGDRLKVRRGGSESWKGRSCSKSVSDSTFKHTRGERTSVKRKHRMGEVLGTNPRKRS